MSLTGPHEKISVQPPQNRLLTGRAFVSILSHIAFMALAQFFVYDLTISQPWFCSVTDGHPDCFAYSEEGLIESILPNPKCDFQECVPLTFETNLTRCDSIVDNHTYDRMVMHYGEEILL